MRKLALSTGGDLGQPTEELFAKARIRISRSEKRAFAAKLKGLPYFDEVIFCKPAEIPGIVHDGDVEFGITGMDCVREHGRSMSYFRIIRELDYACAGEKGNRCAIFCKEDRVMSGPTDFGKKKDRVIKSEYPQETRDWLKQAGITGVKVIPCRGGAEALVTMGKYPFGVALVATGDTLRANHLKVVDVIFESKTVIVGRTEPCSNEAEEAIQFLADLLQGTLEAQKKTLLLMHVPTSKIDAIRNKIPAMKTPTIQPLDDETLSVTTVVPNEQVNALIFQLRREGASAFVATEPRSVM